MKNVDLVLLVNGGDKFICYTAVIVGIKKACIVGSDGLRFMIKAPLDTQPCTIGSS